jgi:hypothetical protein
MSRCCPTSCPCRNARDDLLTDMDIRVLADLTPFLEYGFHWRGVDALEVLERARGLVTPKKLAHLLSFHLLTTKRLHGVGYTLLLWAIERCSHEIVEWLVLCGVCLHAGVTMHEDACWSARTPWCQPRCRESYRTPAASMMPLVRLPFFKLCWRMLLDSGMHPSYFGV